jgi:hypothetical protein
VSHQEQVRLPGLEAGLDAGVQRSAEMSLDQRYRYRLDRVWDPKGSLCLFCGVNPSETEEEA